jgi:hypothetical protein
MWMLMTGCKGGYDAHSVHARREDAESWRACLAYAGTYSEVCFVGDDVLQAIQVHIESKEIQHG